MTTQEAAFSQFRWYELQTNDPDAARAFYCTMIGWTARRTGSGPDAYTIFSTEKGGVAGMRALGPGDGGPGWVGYVAVDDVDAYAERIKAQGGFVRQPPVDVPGLLRFALVADPQSAPFAIFKGDGPDGPPIGTADEIGYVGWHELMAFDGAQAFDFYSSLFGWSATRSFDMGPMGPYQIWTDGRGGETGGMMTRPPAAPGPAWNFYVQVDSIEAAIARINAAGGVTTNGPHQVPGGTWIVQGRDPQGAGFSCVSPRK